MTRNLPKPEVADGRLIWSTKGTYTTEMLVGKTAWIAELTFEKDRLTMVEIHLGE